MRRQLLQILSCALALAGCERSPEALMPPVIVAVHVEAGYDSVSFEVETEGTFLEGGLYFGPSPESVTPLYGSHTESGYSLSITHLEEGAEYWYCPFVSNGRETIRSAGDYVTTQVYPYVRIPDPVFKAWLVARFDTDGDGEISPAEARAVDVISCNEGKGARSLKGIEAFVSLTSLEWENDLLEELDFSQNTRLEFLHLNNNRLRTIDLSKNTRLKGFWAEDNEIEYLDLSGLSNLHSLSMARSPLRTLVLPEECRIENMWLHSAELSEIDLSGSSKLKSLTIHENHIVSLDISACRQLRLLYCFWNDGLTSLDLTGLTELEDLRCAQGDFHLSGLDLSDCPQLRYLYCNEDRLKTLDLSANPLLEELGCYDNPDLGPVLDLTAQERLDSLDAHNCPRLEEIWIKAGHVISRGIIKDAHTKIIEK